MGFGVKKDSEGREYDLNEIYEKIKETIKKFNENNQDIKINYFRGDDYENSGSIKKSIYFSLLKADIVIADMSALNANAMYEIGFRHACRKKHTILMQGCKSGITFDVNDTRVITYDHGQKDKGISEKNAEELQSKLLGTLNNILDSNIEEDSPFYELCKTATEVTYTENLNFEDFLGENSEYKQRKQAEKCVKENNSAEAAKIYGTLKINTSRYGLTSDYTKQQAHCLHKSATKEKDKHSL